MLAFLLATTVLAKPHSACAGTKDFVGTAQQLSRLSHLP